MKTIIKLSLISLTLIALSSCGGGGSCPDSTHVLALDVQCNANNDLSTYIALQSGDIVSKEETNTTINIFHDQNNAKVACIQSGRAVIIRSS